jgi:large subunit ribosomal protein L10
MSLTLEHKQAVVADVRAVAARAQSVIAAQYSGMSVAKMTEFRAKARAAQVEVRVVKNTLAKRAFQGTDFECLGDALHGPLVLIFSRQDPGAGARLTRDFAKQNEHLVTRAIAFSGALLPAASLDKLATMPTRDEARAMLLRTFKAPLSKLVRTLAEPAAKLARVLAARRDQAGK